MQSLERKLSGVEPSRWSA